MLISSEKKQSCFGDQNCTHTAFSIWLLHFCYFSLFFSDCLKTLLTVSRFLVSCDTLKNKRKPAVFKLDNKGVFPLVCSQPLGSLDSGCVCRRASPSLHWQATSRLQATADAPTECPMPPPLKLPPPGGNVHLSDYIWSLSEKDGGTAPTRGKKKCFSHRQWTPVTDLPVVCIQMYYVVFNVIRCKEQADGSTVERLATQPKRSKVVGGKKTVFKASKLTPC